MSDITRDALKSAGRRRERDPLAVDHNKHKLGVCKPKMCPICIGKLKGIAVDWDYTKGSP